MATQVVRSLESTPQTGKFCISSSSKFADSRGLQPSVQSKVRVIVRVRPFLPDEISQKNGNPISCISALDSELESRAEVRVLLKDQETSRNECFKLDAFFGEVDNGISKIFQNEVRPLILRIFQGCNATIFAYGATGSGKTYTMQGTDELPGLMPLAMATILSMCHQTETTVKISYYEVYMDRCYDLLELKDKEVAILDGKDGQIHLKGLAQVRVNSISQFHELFSYATQRRKVAHTGINDVSSRSHGVLVISVSSPCDVGTGNFAIGKLNLIDLAGNEDNRKTGNDGIRLQESAKINQSLFALSNVIYALNNNAPRIPYRESKLTRILQDSLGGTSSALMVACLNPGEYQESVHTVTLAARSRQIYNFISSAQKRDTPTVKIDMEAKLRAWLESKGKTRSVQRMNGLGSPLISKTPNCTSSSKKQNAFWNSAKPKTVTSSSSSYSVKRVPQAARRNLFNYGGLRDSAMEDQDLDVKRISKEEFEVPFDNVAVKSTPPALDKSATEEEKVATVECSTNFSPTSEKIKALFSPSRKVLSPVDCNKNAENISAGDHQKLCLPGQRTPKTVFVVSSTENNFDDGLGTPLEKFNVHSSNLKNSLVHEYVEFLNTASREELLELKGIGHKMAEYIVELRTRSPLKSLTDLEKIGLSSKQVHNMFTRAATGVLGSTMLI